MGCCAINTKKRKFQNGVEQHCTSSIDIKMTHFKRKKTNHRISKAAWLHILDYLSYNELKEVGKVNRMFNRSIRSPTLLLKFFKKKIDCDLYNSKDSTDSSIVLYKEFSFRFWK